MFNLKEAQEAIKDKPEFRCNEREYGWVIDYNVAFEDTFEGKTPRESMILCNLRGTCFDKDGKIIRLMWHKFMNLNQNEEYSEKNFDLKYRHVVEEKLDGSLVAPISFNDSWKFGTRAGVTDVSEKAQRLMDSWHSSDLEKYLAYKYFIEDCIALKLVPMFEFCSREQRIVIDYPVSKLVLTGIRSCRTGNYTVDIESFVNDPFIDIVPVVGREGSSVYDLSKIVKEWEGREGVVVKFPDGRMVKIKADDYCLKHKALDGLRFEKDVLKMILTGKIDDVMPLVTPEVRERLAAYSSSVHARLKIANDEMVSVFERNKNAPSKKEFASLVMQSPYKTGLFRMWDGQEYSLADFVLSKCGSSSSVEEVRHLIGKSFLDF